MENLHHSKRNISRQTSCQCSFTLPLLHSSLYFNTTDKVTNWEPALSLSFSCVLVFLCCVSLSSSYPMCLLLPQLVPYGLLSVPFLSIFLQDHRLCINMHIKSAVLYWKVAHVFTVALLSGRDTIGKSLLLASPPHVVPVGLEHTEGIEQPCFADILYCTL